MKLIWLFFLMTLAACQDSNKSIATDSEEVQTKNNIRQQLHLDPMTCRTPVGMEEYAYVLRENIAVYEETGTLEHCL